MIDMLRRLFGGRETGPIVVGAVGGSGTRAMHGLLKAAGAFMGTNLNYAGDAMDFEPFLDEIINPTLDVTRSLDYGLDRLPPALRADAANEFARLAEVYQNDRPADAPAWGWKNPRSMYILPYIQAAFPDVRFIHLIRDGRDMAFSNNQNQPRKHYAALFGADLPEEPALAAIRLWSKANLEVQAWGRRNLGRRYFQIRLEDICSRPEADVPALLARLGLPGRDPALPGLMRLPDSVGRWQGNPLADQVAAEGAEGLRAFGYM